MMTELSDEALIERIQGGDKAACAICMDRYGPDIYRLALSLLHNEADAEDVMQETFLNAFRAMASFEGRANIKTWLYRITYNNALMRLRKTDPTTASIEEIWLTETGFVPRQLFDWCCLPEREVTIEEVRQELETAVTNLPPKLQTVFIMREVEGLSTQETAETLNISIDVVKTRLYRARQHLQEHLNTFADTPER
ncbi:MAG: sigma-70 family RNA polymerase sigma factor [Candidatus Promineifilaceae bacterium]